MRRRSACRIAAPLALAFVASSCAPHRLGTPVFDVPRGIAAYRGALATREALGPVVDSELNLWIRGKELGHLPGVHARLAVRAPDAFRMRIESAFGVALDIAAHGDSLAAYAPGERLGLVLDAAADTLGVRSPGALGYRVMSAAWSPPGEAWSAGRIEDSLLVVRWSEAGDSLVLGVGSNGLPRWILLRGPGGATATASYRAWVLVDRTPWPSRVEFEDGAARIRLTLRLTRVRRNAHPAPRLLSVQIPPGAERLDWTAFRRALERAKGL